MARAPRPPSILSQLPAAALGALGRRAVAEWRASALHRLAIAGPQAGALATRPRDLRPGDPLTGARLLRGEIVFYGEGLQLEPGGDPWRRPSPNRRYAVALHDFRWARDLLTAGEPGARTLLRFWLEWRRVYARFNAFAWSGEVLERRLFNLACAAGAILPLASEAEAGAFADDLARQARHLIGETGAARATERMAVAAIVGVALGGRAGEHLLARALPRLSDVIADAVRPDGVHASRSPERGLELLFDLMTLDDALAQAGAPAPSAVARAIDRLAAGARLFTLGEARLASFHGGEAGGRQEVAAALELEAARGEPVKSAVYGRYHRLEGRSLALLVDTGAPPGDPWAGTACAQPAAIAVSVEGRSLVVGSAWSAKAEVGGLLRGPAGGSCLALDGRWPAATLRRRFLAGEDAARLEVGSIEVRADRQGAGDETWLAVVHDGWLAHGFEATRRLYVDYATDELRGEDILSPAGRARPVGTEALVRFHLAPGVAAQVAVDARSAVLRPPGARGWRLRSNADMRLDPGVVFEHGEPRATQVLTLAAPVDDAGVRLRWKLARDEG